MANNNPTTKIVMGQVADVAALLGAARKLRDAGYKQFDCYAPFPVHGLNKAMGLERSKLGFIVGTFAAIGLGGAYFMQYWMSSVDYPIIVSNKPFNSYQAFMPVTFAVTVLLSAFATFIGMLALNRLPRFNHAAFLSKRFEKVTDEGFFVGVKFSDPKFDEKGTFELLKSAGCENLEVWEG